MGIAAEAGHFLVSYPVGTRQCLQNPKSCFNNGRKFCIFIPEILPIFGIGSQGLDLGDFPLTVCAPMIMPKANTSIKEIDFDILEQVEKHPGITAVEIGRKVHISRFTALIHTEKLESLQFLRRKQATNGTYFCYLQSSITLEAIQQFKRLYEKSMVDSIQDILSLSDLQDLQAKLLKLTKKPRKTLIDISVHGEIQL